VLVLEVAERVVEPALGSKSIGTSGGSAAIRSTTRSTVVTSAGNRTFGSPSTGLSVLSKTGIRFSIHWSSSTARASSVSYSSGGRTGS